MRIQNLTEKEKDMLALEITHKQELEVFAKEAKEAEQRGIEYGIKVAQIIIQGMSDKTNGLILSPKNYSRYE